jgi:hypothetical protein
MAVKTITATRENGGQRLIEVTCNPRTRGTVQGIRVPL